MASFFEFRVKGRLDRSWGSWFDGFSICDEGEDITVICGQVADQASLHGTIERIRDLNLPLISVIEKKGDAHEK
jgi:hypothetical protein